MAKFIFEEFKDAPVGTVKRLNVSEFMSMVFVKSSDVKWFVEVALRNCEAFPYSRFTESMTQIQASCLYESYVNGIPACDYGKK